MKIVLSMLFQDWVKGEFPNAKEIQFDIKVTPKLILDCYLETKDGYTYIFTLNKHHIENLKDTVKNTYQMIWANEFLYVSIDDHEDAASYLNFFYNELEYNDIMDINEIEVVDVIKSNIVNDKLIIDRYLNFEEE